MFIDDEDVEIDPLERGFEILGLPLSILIIVATGGLGIFYIYFIGLE